MRRPVAVACVTLALLAGAGTGVGLRSALPHGAVRPTSPTPSSANDLTPPPGSSPTPTPSAGSPDRNDLLQTSDLGAAGWGSDAVSTAVTTHDVDPNVSPCQRPGPFTGLDRVVVARWRSTDRQAGEVVALASSSTDARRRAQSLYEQHVSCAELDGRTVGPRHAVAVDGGSITWFAVTDDGRAGFSSVLRQSDRFAVIYVDAAGISADRLPALLLAAAKRLR